MLHTTRYATSDAPDLPKGRQSEHSRITESLRQRIRNGDWAPGCVIPGRRHLAAEYKVAPATMERAIVPLLADGTLRADDRRGTFVAETTAQVTSTAAPTPEGVLVGGRIAQRLAPPSYRQGPIAIVASLYAPDCRDIGQNDHWIREIVGALENELAEHGRYTAFVNRVPRHALEPVRLRESLEQAVSDETLSGLALISFDLTRDEIEEAYDIVSRYRFPVVSVVSEALSLPVPHIMLDNHRAGFQAGQYLLERGHRNLTVLLPERASWAEERLAGIHAAASRARLAPDSITVLRGEDQAWTYNGEPMEIAARAIELAFEGGWKPNGPVVCATDMVAIVLMDMLSERGYKVGSEIPVLGFDDHELSRDVGLTTMRPPMRAMGAEAARLLLAGPESHLNGCQIRLCSKLIPRSSTMAHPRPVHNPLSQTAFRATPEAAAV